jgi:CRISP-associated protein Cas1
MKAIEPNAFYKVENDTIDERDFSITENYNLRLRGPGGKKVANEFSNMLNKPLSYGDKQTTWGLYYC